MIFERKVFAADPRFTKLNFRSAEIVILEVLNGRHKTRYGARSNVMKMGAVQASG